MTGEGESGDRRWRPVVPGYELVDELGRGGFGTVYRAVQLSVDREVALKVVTMAALGSDAEHRFKSECRTIGQLSWHPNIVPLYDAGITQDGTPYLVMEMMPGGSLGDRMRITGAFTPRDVVGAGLQVADALNAAHVTGVLHRDVKPDNCFIDRRGVVRLGDFGIATLVDETHSATGSYAATLNYAAPELFSGQRATSRSDVFALGATLYALLTGRAPFASDPADDSPMAVMWRVANDPLPPVPDSVPTELANVLKQALEKDPASRQPSAQVFHDQLRRIQAGPAAPNFAATPHGSIPPPPDPTPPPAHLAVPPTAPPPIAYNSQHDDDSGNRGHHVSADVPPLPLGGDDPAAVHPPVTAGRGRRRRSLIVAGGVATVLLLGGVVAANAMGGDSSGGKQPDRRSTTEPSSTTTDGTTTTAKPTTTAPPVPDRQDIATADVSGSWTGTGTRESCEGSFCSDAANSTREIWFDVPCTSEGCQLLMHPRASGTAYPTVPLSFDGSFHSAGERAPAEFSYLCNDVPVNTLFDIRFESYAVDFDDGKWLSNRVRGTYKMVSTGSACGALSETYSFDFPKE